ncbi:MAG TPA: DUF3307 domain-containing protein [Bacteroidales bacterium]|nr:DUF3307 domain-containing protein [Bacteroidales bacterium]HNR42121.1 DUF3307 domain-containing protein [Bacteroidales bacterium]
MDLARLLTLQLIAHLLSDFILQPDAKSNEKNISGFRSNYLKWHILFTFLCSWILSFQLSFIFAAALISILHWVIDGLKRRIDKISVLGDYTFFIDQTLHLTSIIVITLFFSLIFEIRPDLPVEISFRFLMIIGGYLVCAKPSNAIIKEIIKVFKISIEKNNPDAQNLPNAGRLIGIIERWLVFTFILLSQYELIGFLIAAKSILRFRDDDTIKSEYVVVGTMLSFGLAIATGILTTIIPGIVT